MDGNHSKKTEKALEGFETDAQPFAVAEEHCKAQALLCAVSDMFKVERQATELTDSSLQASEDIGYRLDLMHLSPSGIISGNRKDTCVLLPFLYLALGRRLNYPLRLATIDGHLCLRWDGQAKFDFDWRSFHSPPVFTEPVPGLYPPPDEKPPTSSPNANLLSKADEIAMLFNVRGACFESFGMNSEALIAYAQAHRISPSCRSHVIAIARIMTKITPLFGHTSPMPAPDYSQRLDFVLESHRQQVEWDKLEREFLRSLPYAKTVEESNRQQRLRAEFQQRRTDAKNELLLREAREEHFGVPAREPGQQP